VSAPKSKVRPHLFEPDPELPADQNGRRVCLRCHLVGEAGDKRHTIPPAPAEDVQRWRAHDVGES
jgi:hypothetical protein